MHNYEKFKQQVEKTHGKDMEDILFEKLVKEGKGPSVSGRDLGIPRKVVVHFCNEYKIKDQQVQK